VWRATGLQPTLFCQDGTLRSYSVLLDWVFGIKLIQPCHGLKWATIIFHQPWSLVENVLTERLFWNWAWAIRVWEEWEVGIIDS
jgi:hypothetical protein